MASPTPSTSLARQPTSAPRDSAQFQRLVDFLRTWEYTDQLLTASNWLHISWNPFDPPRHFIRIGYYK